MLALQRTPGTPGEKGLVRRGPSPALSVPQAPQRSDEVPSCGWAARATPHPAMGATEAAAHPPHPPAKAGRGSTSWSPEQTGLPLPLPQAAS